MFDTTILGDLKGQLAINDDGGFYDVELLTIINGANSVLYQLGYDTGTNVIVDETTEYSIYGSIVTSVTLIRIFMGAYARSIFDPSDNSNVRTARAQQLAELKERIRYCDKEV